MGRSVLGAGESAELRAVAGAEQLSLLCGSRENVGEFCWGFAFHFLTFSSHLSFLVIALLLVDRNEAWPSASSFSICLPTHLIDLRGQVVNPVSHHPPSVGHPMAGDDLVLGTFPRLGAALVPSALLLGLRLKKTAPGSRLRLSSGRVAVPV